MGSEPGASTALNPVPAAGRFPRPPCASAAGTSRKTWPGSPSQEARLMQGVRAPLPPSFPAPPALQWLGTTPLGTQAVGDLGASTPGGQVRAGPRAQGPLHKDLRGLVRSPGLLSWPPEPPRSPGEGPEPVPDHRDALHQPDGSPSRSCDSGASGG